LGQEVVEVNGKPVRSLAAFNQFVAAGANRQASVTVLENGVRRVLKLELVPLIQLNRQLMLKRLGFSTAPLTEAQAASYAAYPQLKACWWRQWKRTVPRPARNYSPGWW
jgi:hypothetical protein